MIEMEGWRVAVLCVIPIFTWAFGFFGAYCFFHRNEKSKMVRLRKFYDSVTSPKKRVWYDVEEHLPEPFRLVLTYSEIFGQYELAYLDPQCGWSKKSGSTFANITAWCDDELFLPFEATNQINEFLAREKGLI